MKSLIISLALTGLGCSTKTSANGEQYEPAYPEAYYQAIEGCVFWQQIRCIECTIGGLDPQDYPLTKRLELSVAEFCRINGSYR